MATFVLIHGAGSNGWYWHFVEPLLRAEGHDVVTMDLPCDDDGAGLADYTDAVVQAAGDRTDLIMVGQSLGGLVAPLVCERLPVRMIVLVAAMVPTPGEAPGEWWTNTGHAEARAEAAQAEGWPPGWEDDPEVMFVHDVPDDVAEEAGRGIREQSGTPFELPWPLATWPSVPTRFLLCRDDRFFPADFQRRVVRDRLGITPDEMQGGHLPALAHPQELAQRLLAYAREIVPSPSA